MPLFVLLLMSFISLGFFLPAEHGRLPGLVVRAIVALTLFTAAYVAEIVRGGLQSLPQGADRSRPGARTVAGQDDGTDRAARRRCAT